MGWFDRKKVIKAAPELFKPVPVNQHPSQYHHTPSNPPAQQSSRHAASMTQAPPYWQPQPHHQAQYQHPPPPYHPYPNQHHQQQQTQPHHPQDWSQQNPQRGGHFPQQQQQHQQPIVVNQHYYLHPPPSHLALPAPSGTGPPPTTATVTATACPLGLDKFTGSMVTIAKDFTSPTFLEEPNFHPHATQLINSTAAYVDQIAGCFNDVMTLIDRDRMVGNEKALFTYQNGSGSGAMQQNPSSSSSRDGKRGGGGGGGGRSEKSGPRKTSKEAPSAGSKGQSAAVATCVVSGGYFAKVELYANSKLPMNLPHLRLYIPTWPLLCMAAQYAERVYDHPKGAERDAHVSADWKTGTKAMVIKSVPMDHMNTIVFAIRGSATFMDWAVNLNTAPASPDGFLDDAGNSCHAGFLAVARKMVKPVAARLRQLLEEDPGRAAYSLLITGHSAGGAVASLLYAHMVATSARAGSELNALMGCFKRVHCVTFGTPPVSLLPLRRPERPELRKSLFLTFVNEGDPIARADKAYVKSLLELYATPAPAPAAGTGAVGSGGGGGGSGGEKKGSGGARRLVAKASKMSLVHHAPGKESDREKERRRAGSGSNKPVWPLPPGTLSSPGRIVVLRSGDPKARLRDRKTVAERLDEGVVAQTVSDEELRGVIWGDPVCHVMKLYSGRIETLAVGAVTGRQK
ncbi:vegetative cell wall protein gp1 [Colletotrichum orchidophilum]|uniref:Vegetative cell wall protein gp1 n=1 Tax=Colletotrichum orchidophilum TaxID=1209926 RepID=A0A1G4B6Z7_9PEZI|nr:vegetative cell wall protein gp1 [Colletotrichum orchidophilum]OHE97106.1 vegetative cell wall protein gp1 [Colletotrichum orchidophilum]